MLNPIHYKYHIYNKYHKRLQKSVNPYLSARSFFGGKAAD